MSCVASCRSFSNTNSTMIVAKPSTAVDVILSTPLIEEIASSIGSITSCSTTSGEDPGYGTETLTTGGSISGNSSVSRIRSASAPNTTSASITTVVTIEFLIENSEIHMVVTD